MRMSSQEGLKKELLKESKKLGRDDLFQLIVGLFKPFIVHRENGMI